MDSVDVYSFLYHSNMMQSGNYLKVVESKEECVICFHNTAEKTIMLLEEHQIKIDPNIIRDKNFISPFLIYVTRVGDEFGVSNVADKLKIRRQLGSLKDLHQEHLNASEYKLK